MKRIFDLIFSVILLLILAPLMAILSTIIFFTIGRPILFKQTRPGLNEKIFTLYKFRTMTERKNNKGELFSDEIRLTALGRFLRATSLDELPQLINVLKGNMSFVGPRPLLLEYLPLYNPQQKRRHAVKPGITGWAQINGRNNISWDEKFKFDIWYVEHQSFLLDLRILLRTIKKVAVKEGINLQSSATTEKFTGNLN